MPDHTLVPRLDNGDYFHFDEWNDCGGVYSGEDARVIDLLLGYVQ